MEDDVFQGRHARRQRLLAVLVPEEARIGKARAQHALVAGDDGLGARAARRGFHVGGQQEAVGQTAVRLLRREVLLMTAHRGREHLRRQVHVARVDAAHQDLRPLDEAAHLVQQGAVLFQCHARFGGQRRRLLGDDGAPLGGIEHHLGVAELHPVVVEANDVERLRRQEAVPGRGGAEGQPPRLAHRQGAGQRHPVEDGDDAVQRAHPALRVAGPAHRLGPGQLGEGLAENLRQHLGAGPPGDVAHDEIEGALVGLAQLGLFVQGLEAVGLHEALDRLGRRAVLRAFLFLGQVRLLRRQAVDHQGQAARRGKGLGALEGEVRGLQAFGHQTLQVSGGARLHARGNLFGKEFDEQLGHQPASPVCPGIWVATQASQQALARVRTRPM